MNNLKGLEKKLENLKAEWSLIAFGTEFSGEKKYEVMGKIEEEIFVIKLEITKMKKVLGL